MTQSDGTPVPVMRPAGHKPGFPHTQKPAAFKRGQFKKGLA